MLRNLTLVVAVVVAAAIIAGPTGTSAAELPAQTAGLLPVEQLIRVPLTRQATNYTCGAAAVQSVMGYYGDEFREDTLAKALKTSKTSGTDYEQIVSFAKSRGYQVTVKTGLSLQDLQHWLDQRLPVICLIQAWPDKPVDLYTDWDDGHYVVATGYDAKNIYFMDPSTLGNYTYIPADEFVNRWHDQDRHVKVVHFGLVMTKDQPKFDHAAIKPLK